jgi:threonylcarbamoyladenosine tRNA methylthiotransferase MtaB
VAGCVVTGAAERDTRRFLNRVRREAPGGKIAAVGCLAERLARFPDERTPPDLIVALEDRPRLAEQVGALFDPAATGGGRTAESGFFFVPSFKTHDRSRYFFKIQDGCDGTCVYCLVRRVRGPLASLPLPRLLEHLRTLLDHGIKEVVFCGTRLGSYGRDLADGTSPERLAESLETLQGEFRWRFSSMEPWDLRPELLDRLSRQDRFCRFFHIALQSGSDGVLRRMKRPYRARDFQGLIEAVRAHFPGSRIGTDIIVGFPGETRGEFEETLGFLSSCSLDYLHIFPFSKRPGLPDLSGALPPREIKARQGKLMALDAGKRETYRRGQLGMKTTALSIGPKGILEDNHLCRFDLIQPAGVFIPCTITGWDGATAHVKIEV